MGRRIAGSWGAIMVGHLKPLGTGLALAEALDMLVNERYSRLTGFPNNRHFCKFGGWN